MAKETKIDELSWESQAQQHDFFGETNIAPDKVDITFEEPKKEGEDKVVVPDKAKVDAGSEEDEGEEEENDVFSSFSKEASEEEEEEEDNEEEGAPAKAKKGTAVKVNSMSTLAFLKEKGLVNYDLEEGTEMTEELAESMLEDTWENSIEAATAESIKDLPQDLKDLIKFVGAGGDMGTMLTKLATNASAPINANSDMDLESNQILALSSDLRDQGYDEEDIEDQIALLKGNGKLEARAVKAFNKIVEKQSQATSTEVANIAAQREANKKRAREYKNNITGHINSLTEVKGMPISKTDKVKLPTYISEPSVEMKDGRYVSQFQADIFDIMADKDQVTLLAKLVSTKFDFSALTKKEQTAAARQIKEVIQNTEKVTPKSSESKGKKKPIWDMLD